MRRAIGNITNSTWQIKSTLVLILTWIVCLADWMWLQSRLPFSSLIHGCVFTAAALLATVWIVFARSLHDRVLKAAVYSAASIVLWQFSVFACGSLGLTAERAFLAFAGTAGLFMLGLGWCVWGLERTGQRLETARRHQLVAAQPTISNITARSAAVDNNSDAGSIRNPLDPAAWYYGRNPRLNQSLAALASYSLVFLLLFLISTQIGGCSELYEMPAGGGEQQTIAQTVKVQKIIRKKFVVNPFSAISFKTPKIDEVKLQLTEITEHAYKVGYGEGVGAGFAGGTQLGEVRFIRLEYSGGDWDQDFGIGADVNMLIEYGIRTQQKTAKRTESRTIGQLKNFPVGKSPPMVYLTGQKNISVSSNEVKILREYLLDKHGMIFGDNGGSGHFHNQFVGLMRRVLPNVRPSRIPLDDVIHRIPFQIPFLPYVAPHGGRDALGWRVDGRLLCYYHPGDIGDAWTDDHSGVAPEIYEACYQLGTNVIFYAHTEYSKWLASKAKRDQ